MKNEELKVRLSNRDKNELKRQAAEHDMNMSEYVVYLIRKGEKKMDNRKIYFVANDNGDIAGHDLDLMTAENCLAEMIEQEPDAGWEILSNEE